MVGGVVIRQQREAPKFGACGFAPPLEEDGVICFIDDGDGFSVKEDVAAFVAEWDDTKEGVFERGHDFATANRECWEEVVSLG